MPPIRSKIGRYAQKAKFFVIYKTTTNWTKLFVIPPIVLKPAMLNLSLQTLYRKAIISAPDIPPKKLVKNGIGCSVPLIIAPRIIRKKDTKIESNGPNVYRVTTVDILARPNFGPGIKLKSGGSIQFSTIARAINTER